MATAQEVEMWKKGLQKSLCTKKEVTKKRGIKESMCGRRITYDDSSWETSLFWTRGTRRWYCHHLQMK